MNQKLIIVALALLANNSNAMEPTKELWRTTIWDRMLLLKKNSHPDLSPEAIASATITADNRESLNVPVKDGDRTELPLRLAIEAFRKNKDDNDAMILLQQLLSSGADANKESLAEDKLSPLAYAQLHNLQAVIDAIETFESLVK